MIEGDTVDELVVESDITGDDGWRVVHRFAHSGVTWGGEPVGGGLGLRLQQTAASHVSMMRRQGNGLEALLGTTIIDVDSGAELLPPPLNAVRQRWGHDLPRINRWKELVVQEFWTDSPFGDVPSYMRIVGGRVVDHQVGISPEPSLTIARPYVDVLAECAGAIDGLDSFARADMSGDIGAVMQFAGWFESEPCAVARRMLSAPSDRAFAVLGQILSSPTWQAAVDRDNSVEVGPV